MEVALDLLLKNWFARQNSLPMKMEPGFFGTSCSRRLEPQQKWTKNRDPEGDVLIFLAGTSLSLALVHVHFAWPITHSTPTSTTTSISTSPSNPWAHLYAWMRLLSAQAHSDPLFRSQTVCFSFASLPSPSGRCIALSFVGILKQKSTTHWFWMQMSRRRRMARWEAICMASLYSFHQIHWGKYLLIIFDCLFCSLTRKFQITFSLCPFKHKSSQDDSKYIYHPYRKTWINKSSLVTNIFVVPKV